jgi:hypothetical protein
VRLVDGTQTGHFRIDKEIKRIGIWIADEE